jgi:hypothetical protein
MLTGIDPNFLRFCHCFYLLAGEIAFMAKIYLHEWCLTQLSGLRQPLILASHVLRDVAISIPTRICDQLRNLTNRDRLPL